MNGYHVRIQNYVIFVRIWQYQQGLFCKRNLYKSAANKFNNVRVKSLAAISGIEPATTEGGMGHHLPASSTRARASQKPRKDTLTGKEGQLKEAA
jgi:hypothetical protein